MADSSDQSAERDVLYLTTLPLPSAFLDRLHTIFPRLQVEQCLTTSADEIPPDLWRNVQILHTNTVLPRRTAAPALRMIQLDTSGIDHITGTDIWTETEIPVTTIRGVSARWMAEYVLMMMLAFSHALPEMLHLQARRYWPTLEERWEKFGPSPLIGAKVAVVGFGRIGRAIGDLCAALGMHVVGVRRRAGEGTAASAEPAGSSLTLPAEGPFPAGTVEEAPIEHLQDVLEGAHYVVLVLPLTPATRGLIDAAIINAMNEGTVLINVARGGIVDEEALASALREGRLGGAAFDVFATEPLPIDSPLWDLPNFIVSPHVAGLAGDYITQIEQLVTENIRRLLNGEPLLNVADRQAGY